MRLERSRWVHPAAGTPAATLLAVIGGALVTREGSVARMGRVGRVGARWAWRVWRGVRCSGGGLAGLLEGEAPVEDLGRILGTGGEASDRGAEDITDQGAAAGDR